jgi:hypothetical protein
VTFRLGQHLGPALSVMALLVAGGMTGCGGGGNGGGGGATACEPPQGGANDPQEMSNWVHWQGHSFAAFLPSDQWQKTESMSGVDISSPIGDADASFAYATLDPVPYTTGQLEQQLVSGAGFAGVHIVNDSQPFSVSNGTRESFELSAAHTGAAVHACLTVDVLSITGTYGHDAYLTFSTEGTWAQYEHILHLVAAHITFLGSNPG